MYYFKKIIFYTGLEYDKYNNHFTKYTYNDGFH